MVRLSNVVLFCFAVTTFTGGCNETSTDPQAQNGESVQTETVSVPDVVPPVASEEQHEDRQGEQLAAILSVLKDLKKEIRGLSAHSTGLAVGEELLDQNVSRDSSLSASSQKTRVSLHDIITVVVKPPPQTDSDSDSDHHDRLAWRIAAKVVDIHPDGNVVLEAHRAVTVNNEQWEVSLSGITRPENILPDNSVRSENLAQLQVRRSQHGQIRDDDEPGWLTRTIDRFTPF